MKKTKKILLRGEKILMITALFWLLETFIFLIIEGWHWKASSELEILCDKIVSIGISIGGFFILYAFYRLFKSFVYRDDFKEMLIEELRNMKYLNIHENEYDEGNKLARYGYNEAKKELLEWLNNSNK